MSSQRCLALLSPVNSLLSSELYVFLDSVPELVGGGHVRIWIIEMRRTSGELVTLLLYLVRQQEAPAETSLIWLDSLLFHYVRSHRQLRLTHAHALMWAHVQRRRTEDDSE